MSSIQQITDEKKRRRTISNREAQRRSRSRKEQQYENLKREVHRLRKRNSVICTMLSWIRSANVSCEMENNVLRAQAIERNAGLNYQKSFQSNSQLNGENRAVGMHNNGGILSNAGTTTLPYQHGFDGLRNVGWFDVPIDSLIRQWQSSSSSQPDVASASMVQL